MGRTELSHLVTKELERAGFPAEFALVIGRELSTDFTAKQMLGYLREAKPETAEEVADEMLAILEFRDKCVQKHILEGKRS